MSADTPDGDLIGMPAVLDLDDEEIGAGRIAAVHHESAGETEQTRVNVRNPDSIKNTALDRVEIDEPRDKLLQVVDEECGPPDGNGDPSTMVSHASLLGKCKTKIGLSREEAERTIKAALIAGEVMCHHIDGTRHYCLSKEERIEAVVAEQNTSEDPNVELIEHCSKVKQSVQEWPLWEIDEDEEVDGDE